jgi:hypothetical protein
LSFPATFNVSYYKGDLYQFVIRPKNSDGSPFDISDETHNVYFYISPQRGEPFGINTLTAQAIISDGNITATILPILGNQLNPAIAYFYDVSIEKKINTNELFTLVTGRISVTADITRPGS